MSDLIFTTLGDWMDKIADEYSDTDAVVYPHRNQRWTYREFVDVVNKTAKGLIAMGVEHGDHVSIWATNHPEWLILMFATAKIGAVLVTVNTNYKQFELEYLLKQSDTKTLCMIGGFKDSDYIAHLTGICPELPTSEKGKLNSKVLPYLKNVIFIGEETPDGMFNWNELYEMGESVTDEELAARQRACHPDDVVNMQYTSGTTGFPKGVMLTHYNLFNNGMAIGDCMKFTAKDRLLIHVPLFHCFGSVLGVYACISHATTMVMMEYFNPVRAMQAIQMERCTAVHGVPTMFIAMLEHPDFETYDFSTLRTGIMAGSPCPIKYMEACVEKMNMREITITYGQTEASPGITQTRTDDSLETRINTVGRCLPHCEAKIIDPETGAELPVGANGEIVARGYNIMKGYYNMPEATAQAIDKDGWLHTGDIGQMDENGYFKITGRLKDMIIRGGENVYPREIEEFLYTHPAISDVQVIGVPDKNYGEEVLAFIILKENETATEEEIIAYVKNGLSRFKAPRYVRFVDSFPMTASGKIQKFKLRELGIELLNLQDAASIETA